MSSCALTESGRWQKEKNNSAMSQKIRLLPIKRAVGTELPSLPPNKRLILTGIGSSTLVLVPSARSLAFPKCVMRTRKTDRVQEQFALFGRWRGETATLYSLTPTVHIRKRTTLLRTEYFFHPRQRRPSCPRHREERQQPSVCGRCKV